MCCFRRYSKSEATRGYLLSLPLNSLNTLEGLVEYAVADGRSRLDAKNVKDNQEVAFVRNSFPRVEVDINDPYGHIPSKDSVCAKSPRLFISRSIDRVPVSVFWVSGSEHSLLNNGVWETSRSSLLITVPHSIQQSLHACIGHAISFLGVDTVETKFDTQTKQLPPSMTKQGCTIIGRTWFYAFGLQSRKVAEPQT